MGDVILDCYRSKPRGGSVPGMVSLGQMILLPSPSGICWRLCMVRRVTARISLVEKTSLRQCIRPLVEPRAPGQDEFRCASVLTSRSVVEDPYREQASDAPL